MTSTQVELIEVNFAYGTHKTVTYAKSQIMQFPVISGMLGLTGFDSCKQLPISSEILDYCLSVNTTTWMSVSNVPYPSYFSVIKIYFPEVASKLLLNHSYVYYFIHKHMTPERILHNTCQYNGFKKWSNRIFNFDIVVQKPPQRNNFATIHISTQGHSYIIDYIDKKVYDYDDKEFTNSIKASCIRFLDELEQHDTSLGETIYSERSAKSGSYQDSYTSE